MADLKMQIEIRVTPHGHKSWVRTAITVGCVD
jgi:hypothetical protein